MPRAAQPRPAASKPSLALIGFMGSGKSVVGALVAYRAGAPFFDLDFMIESEAGMTIPEIFSSRGEEGFRALESRLLPSTLREGTVVALGGGTVMDDANWQLIRDRAMSVYLDIPFETIWGRIGRSQNRPLVAGRLRKEVESLFDRSPDYVATDVLALWCD